MSVIPAKTSKSRATDSRPIPSRAPRVVPANAGSRASTLRSLKGLLGRKVSGRDGTVGAIHDFVFDDQFWRIRYVMVDTGAWLSGRKVLLSPEAFRKGLGPDRGDTVELTLEQVKNSPLLDANEPLSRYQLAALHGYYGWSFHGSGGLWPGILPVFHEAAAGVKPAPLRNDPHLRLMREIQGINTLAIDGEIGPADDLIAGNGSWAIRYFVVATRKWLGGRKVLIDPHWLSLPIQWSDRRLEVIAMRESIRNSPKLDPAKLITRRYEASLFEHYGRPKYWERKE